MSKTNSNSKGRFKPRHNNHHQKHNGSSFSRNTVFDSNGPCGKVRGNVSQVIEKYQTAAKDATTQGEHVLAELCLQYADHYNRIAISIAPEQPKRVEKVAETVKTDEDAIVVASPELIEPSAEPEKKHNGKKLNGVKKKEITEKEVDIDIENMDLSIPDFSLIEKKPKKKTKQDNTVKLAIENV